MRLDKLLRYAKELFNGDCDDDKISEATRDLDYHNPKDYMNVDKACKYIGVSRRTFYVLARKHNVEPQYFNNVKIGYYVRDLDIIKREI